MRCPACGFVSFDRLPTCKRCGGELPQQGVPPGIVPAARQANRIPPRSAVAADPVVPLRDEEDASVLAPLEAPVDAGAPADLAALPRAGFWRRGMALLADVALVAALAVAGGMLVGMAVRIGGAFSSTPELALDWLETMATRLLWGLIGLGYFTLFVGGCGQTPGKMLLRLKIVRVTGDAVGYARALVRCLGQGLGVLLLGMGFLMVAFSRRKQGLHDKLTGTCVVRLRS